MFFSGKEGVLIVIDEIDRRSISGALDKKLASLTRGDFHEMKAGHKFDTKKRERSNSTPNFIKTARR